MNHPESDSTMSESRADEMFGAIPIEWDGEKNFETETWRVRAKLLHAETKALETALAAANEALKRAEAANDFNEREIEKTREKIFKMRFQGKGESTENSGSVTSLRRQIARLNTILHERRKAQAEAGAGKQAAERIGKGS